MRLGMMAHPGCGGSARIAASLSEEMSLRGHKVHLLTLTKPFSPPGGGVVSRRVLGEEQPAHGWEGLHTEWSAAEFELFLSELIRTIVEEELDVVHFHYAVPFGFLAQVARERLGTAAPAFVGTLHGTDVSVHGRNPHTRSRLATALRELDAITTVSSSHAHLATELFSLPVAPIIIPNFLNLTRFPRALPHKGRPRLAHVSNFRAVKDPASMVRIFAGVRQRVDAELWLVGDGPTLSEVRALLAGHGDQDVRYWGLRDDVPEILSRTDLLLMTSLSESFCLAALEAMACGVPVLATRVGGLPEVVVHERTGFLFPVGGHDEAVEWAVSLFSDPLEHQALSEVAAAHATRFAHTRIVPLYEQLYDDVLLHSRRHRRARAV
ncbi:MAG: glycosyltransferase [Acidimicrobiales bacterium]